MNDENANITGSTAQQNQVKRVSRMTIITLSSKVIP